jgi:parallel beta-helix repeat protein
MREPALSLPAPPPLHMRLPSHLPRNRKELVVSAVGAVLFLLVAVLTVDIFSTNPAAPVAGGLTPLGTAPRTGTCTGYSLTPANAPNIPAIVAAKPAGTVFCFAPGTYRMTDQIVPRDNDQLIGTGATRADVVLSGAKVLSAWAASGGLYVHSGDVVSLPKSGVCNTGTACQYSDWLFRGNQPITRVLSPCSSTNVKTGRFCVDYGGKKIHIFDNPAGQTMSYSFVPRALDGGTGVVVKNITFDKFASPAGGAKTVRAGTGWLVENIAMQYNHGCAMGVDGTSGTVVQNSRFHDNGQLGYCGSPTGAKFQNNEVDHNNFLGIKAPWGGGGGKFTDSVGVTVANNNVHDNKGNGIWFDLDSKGAVITGNITTNNSGIYGAGSGITYEISCYGTILGNTSSGNGMAGIQLRSSHDNVIGAVGEGNNVANNQIAGIRIIVDRSGTQSHCGAINGSNNRIAQNNVTMPSGTSINGVQNFKPYVASANSFIGNDYHMPSGGCSAARWAWWTGGSASVNVPFRSSGASWQGTFKQDLATGGTC